MSRQIKIVYWKKQGDGFCIVDKNGKRITFIGAKEEVIEHAKKRKWNLKGEV